MGQQLNIMKVNGIQVPYWSPDFCTEGADGLIGANAQILELGSMLVDGVITPYWSADTCGDKYGNVPLPLNALPSDLPTIL